MLIRCQDRRGVIAAVTTAIAQAGGNINDADQHADPDDGRFSMRITFDGIEHKSMLIETLDQLDIQYRIRWLGALPKVAVLCSKETHCIADLLWRASIGELPATITRVISNHQEAKPLSSSFGFPFEHLDITQETKREQESYILDLLEQDQVELIVLARYMQILSPTFLERFPGKIINIHHSFLPAFAGAKPYHRAFARGVKLIGATAHYVTEELDEGPIVTQKTAHVTHRDSIDDMIRKGRDLERVVLAEAVRMHLEDRIIIDGRRTIVFE